MKVPKADNTIFFVSNDVKTNEVIRLLNNAINLTSHDARISASSGTEIEQPKFLGLNQQ